MSGRMKGADATWRTMTERENHEKNVELYTYCMCMCVKQGTRKKSRTTNNDPMAFSIGDELTTGLG